MMKSWLRAGSWPQFQSCIRRPARTCPMGTSGQCPVVPEIRDSRCRTPPAPPRAQRVLLMLALQSHKAYAAPWATSVTEPVPLVVRRARAVVVGPVGGAEDLVGEQAARCRPVLASWQLGVSEFLRQRHPV